MSPRFLTLLLLLFLIWGRGSSSASNLSNSPKLGFFPIVAKNLEAMSFAENMTTLLSNNLDRAGSLEIAERRKLESIIEQEGVRINTLTPQNLHAIGRKSGLDFVLSGSAKRGEGMMEVEIRLLDIRAGRTAYYEAFQMPEYELAARAKKLTSEILAKAAERPAEKAAAPPVEQAPPSPVSLEASGSSTKVRLKWSPPEAAKAQPATYKLFRASSGQGPFAHIGTCSEPSYSDENLKVNEAYYYRVRSVSATGKESEFSDIVVGKTSVAPQPPILLTLSPAVKGAELVWRPRQEGSDQRLVVAGYRVYRKAAGERSFREVAKLSEDATSYADSGLKEGVLYSYTVSSFNSSNVESEFSTAMDVSPLSVNGVQLESLVKRQVTLRWNPSEHEGIQGYSVYRSENRKDGYRKVAELIGRRSSSHTDMAPEISKSYWYAVAAFNNSRAETAISEPVMVTTEGQLPVPPGLTASGGGVRKITLNWQPAGSVKDAVTGYLIYRGEEGNAPFHRIADVSSRVNSYTDDSKSLRDGTTYYYKIGCYDSTGGESPLSEPVSAATKDLPAVPKGLRAASGEPEKVSLAWSGNPESDIKGYEVYRGQPDSAVVSMIAKVTGTSFTDTRLKSGADYIYAVAAVNRDDMVSPLTTAVKARTKPLPAKLQRVRIEVHDGIQVITWESSGEQDVKAYNIYQKGLMGLVTKGATVGTNSYKLEQLKEDAVFFVTALDDDGLESERVEVGWKK